MWWKQTREFRVKRVTLERTMCLGECPVYTVEVDETGHVVWHGERYVKEIGLREWQLSDEQMAALCQLIRGRQFFKYKNEYLPSVTDHPECITTVEFTDGRVKRVQHSVGDRQAPRSLDDLTCDLDDAIGTGPYIGTFEERIPWWREVFGNKTRAEVLPFWGKGE